MGRGTIRPMNNLTIRSATPADRDALARLAQLDSGTLPAHPVLVAELGDSARAGTAREAAARWPRLVPWGLRHPRLSSAASSAGLLAVLALVGWFSLGLPGTG